MRIFLPFLILLALAACDPAQPDDGAVLPVDDQTTTQTEDETEITEADTSDEEGEETTVVVIDTNNPTISDTQDFDQLSQRETIESDAARLKAQREKFKIIEPTALPTRTGSGNDRVVAFALETTHKVGEKKYKRFNPIGGALSRQACARFSIADEAQAAFLKSGGPKRDTRNLDPDGDGFACHWSPEVYRAAVN